ncbi:MAG TPA: hypothetical protein VGH24_02510 [Solirubrobacteraceae bacterium]|jgi:hypothetical protein
MRPAWGAAALVALAAAVPAGVAGADSFTPVRLTIDVAPVARLHKPLAITVRVSADAGALDTRTAPLRIRVKLSNECGGSFAYTTGVVLLDKELSPQPSTGHAYSALASGSGRPSTYGSKVVCTYLEEEGDNRMFANDESIETNVSKACTTAAARYDTVRRTHRRKSRIAAARRAARRACGPGVSI